MFKLPERTVSKAFMPSMYMFRARMVAGIYTQAVVDLATLGLFSSIVI